MLLSLSSEHHTVGPSLAVAAAEPAGRVVTSALVSFLSLEGRFLSPSAALTEQLAALELALPEHLLDLIAPMDRAAVQGALAQVVAGAAWAEVAARLQGSRGGRWFRLQLGRVPAATELQLCAIDIQAQMEATQQCALYQTALDSLPMMIAISDAEANFRIVNEGYCAHYGYARKDMLGQPFTMIIQPPERLRWMQWHRGIIGGTVEPGREAPVVYRDGRRGFVAVTADRLELEDGSRYRMTTISDVTERRRIAQREQLLSAVLRSAPVVTFITDAEGTVTLLEGKGARLLGLDPDAALGQPAGLVLATAPELTAALARALAGEEATAQFSLGPVSCDAWLCPGFGADGKLAMVIGTLLDVTERVRSARILGDQLATIAAQKETISRLLLPILPVWPGVLCVPLLSEAGEALGTPLQEALLEAVVRSRARLILLDLTGMARVEQRTAAQLVSLASAVRLLGARALLTGLRPEVARALVALRTDLSAVRSYATLHEGLRACISEVSSGPSAATARRDSPATS